MALAKDLVSTLGPVAASANGGSVATAIAAAGSLQTDATTVNASIGIVTGADGTKGVILAMAPGDSVTLVNSSASTLKVWPMTGAAISVPGTGLGSANASYAQTLWAVVTYTCISSTQILTNKSA
jgi:hypothetical protein